MGKDGCTDMKLTVSIRNFANAPKKAASRLALLLRTWKVPC